MSRTYLTGADPPPDELVREHTATCRLCRIDRPEAELDQWGRCFICTDRRGAAARARGMIKSLRQYRYETAMRLKAEREARRARQRAEYNARRRLAYRQKRDRERIAAGSAPLAPKDRLAFKRRRRD